MHPPRKLSVWRNVRTYVENQYRLQAVPYTEDPYGYTKCPIQSRLSLTRNLSEYDYTALDTVINTF